MSSTYSQDLRIQLMGSGDQAGTWGTTTNNNFQYILEQAIAGYQSVTITSTNQVLTYLNGASSTPSLNQAVYAALQLTGATSAFNVFTPNSASKLYIINNATSYAATIAVSSAGSATTPAGTTVVIPAGLTAAVYTDGTNFYSQHNYLPGNVTVGGVATATSFSGAGTGLTGTAASLNIGGNAATATTASSVSSLTGGSAGEVHYQSAANTTAFTAVGTNGQVLLSAGAGAPYWSTNIAGSAGNVTGTVAIANGGTGQTTAANAFNAISPILTTGDLIIGNGITSSTRLPIGLSGYVLTSNGSTATWQPSSGGGGGGVTSFSGGSTGLTPSTPSTGAISLSGTLGVAYGGTGASSLAGAGIATVSASNTFSGANTFSGINTFTGTYNTFNNTLNVGGINPYGYSYVANWGLYSRVPGGSNGAALVADASQYSSSLALTCQIGATSSGFVNFVYGSFGTPFNPVIGSISQTGGGTGVAYNTSSDRRLKTNIVDYSNSGAVIDAIKPRSFTWISTGLPDTGFIADELQQIVPNAVNGEPNAVDEKGNPKYQAVDCSTPEMMANIIAELQSLRKRVAALEAK